MLNKNLLKSLFLLMALIIILSACKSGESSGTTNNGTDNGQSAGGESGGDGIVTVTAWSSQQPRVEDFNDNKLTHIIEEKLGINIEFQTAPFDGAKEKQNLLLASGDYPTAFIGGAFSKVDQLKYGELGVFLPLNDLIAEHAPNIQKVFEENPAFESGVTTPDGNIYSLPGADGCYHCFWPTKTWINEEWLKALDLEMPTTIEEFESVMLAFKNEDPNGNGEADEVPLSGHTDGDYGSPIPFLMNSFVYTNPINYLQLDGDQIDLVADNPEWKEGLKYINRLYSQGLIDQEAFTQDMSNLQQLSMDPNAIRLGVYPNLWNGDVVTIYGDAVDQRWNQYVAVPPLEGPNGDRYVTYNGHVVSEGKFAITDMATEEQQIAAIKIADYMYSEEGALSNFVGVGTWVKAEEGVIGTDGKPAIWDNSPESADADWDAPTKDHWDNGFYYMSVDLFHGQGVSQDLEVQDGNEPRLYQENEKYVGVEPMDKVLPDMFIDPEASQTAAELVTVINKYIQQNAVQFAIGAKDIDADWDSYVQGFKDLQVDKYLKIYQDAYEANQNK